MQGKVSEQLIEGVWRRGGGLLLIHTLYGFSDIQTVTLLHTVRHTYMVYQRVSPEDKQKDCSSL